MTKSTVSFIFCLLVSFMAAQQTRARADDAAPSLVMIMVDGVRPDIVAEEVASGHLPNIKKHFYENGTRFSNSYAPVSLTLPSWSALLSGVDLDRSGIKGNETFDRQSKLVENYLDWRRDAFSKQNRLHGRAYRQIRKTGNALVFDWFNRGKTTIDGKAVANDSRAESDIFFTFFPINDKFPAYLSTNILGNMLNDDIWDQTGFQTALMKLLFDYDAVDALDRYGANELIKVIANPKGKKKLLLGAYLASVGHLEGINYERGRQALVKMDYQIGRIFEALRRTRYNDSVVVLVSDRGFVGGRDAEGDNYHNPLRGETYALTATNLSYYLSGWYNKPGYADYNFNVESPYAAEGKFSLMNFSEFKANPFQCTNLARALNPELKTCASYRSERPDQITAAVTSSQAISIPFASRSSNDWVTPNNWYTLTHYKIGVRPDGSPLVKNLVQDLEDFRIDNLAVFNSTLAKKIGNKPLDWLAVVVSKEDLARSPKVVAQSIFSQEDAILIHKSAESQALVLHRTNAQQEDTYRYVPIRHFEQTSSGEISFEPNLSDDPLGYTGSPFANRQSTGRAITDVDWFAQYHPAREWVARYSKTAFPTVVSGLSKFLSYKGEMAKHRNRLHSDIYLNPNYGHVFTVANVPQETYDGMWQKEAVQNTFMMSGPNVKKGVEITTPVFATDVLPTALKAAKMEDRIQPGDGEVIQDALE